MEYPTDNWIVNWAKNLVLILHDYLLVSAGDKSSIPFNPCVKWVFYFLHKKSTCSCLLHTMLLSLNNSKRKRYKLLLLNIFMFALLLDSNATLCVYDIFFVYYLAMLLGVVCYHTCITCFSLCLLLTSGFVTTCMYNHFCFISKNLKNVIHLHVIVLSAMMFLFLFIFLWFTLMLKCSFAFCICWDIEIFGFIIRFVHVGTFVKYNCSFFIKL